MNADTFLNQHGLTQNPFAAEEARLDPVFEQLEREGLTHPDYPKIAGNLATPSCSVVFGEKGSGKTAMRLHLAREIGDYNQSHPDRKNLLIPYDDLNPFLDHLLRSRKQDVNAMFGHIRLVDHQDAILSAAVTRLVSALLGEPDNQEEAVTLPGHLSREIRKIPRQKRHDLCALAALYDQPQSGNVVSRLKHLKRKLKLGRSLPIRGYRNLGMVLLVLFVVLFGLKSWVVAANDWPFWATLTLWASLVAGVAALGYWANRLMKVGSLTRRIMKETPAIQHSRSDLKSSLLLLKREDLSRQPWPTVAGSGQADIDSRYQLTRRLLEVIAPFGYSGVLVLVDRVDEPSLIAGDSEKMRAVVWPMFDAKFLQQPGVGIKLLLPLELRYELRRESGDFFREARLDKGNLIERLQWTGAMLYDICNARLRACQEQGAEAISLTDLFEPEVSRETLIDALDQMLQPRDAFKFLYALIQEHCRNTPEEAGQFQIDRSTLETVRRLQKERVQELHRGLTPA